MNKVFLIFSIVFVFAFNSHAESKNPFKEGVEKIDFSSEEIEEIKSYVVNSEFLLEEALEKAKGKNLSSQKEILGSSIRKVVLYSNNNRGIDELLMRIILNQALELTLGIPNANGFGLVKSGLLNNKVSTDILVEILRDHIVMAVKYAKYDLKFIESGNLLEIPFNSVAIYKLNISKKWLAAVFFAELQNELYQMLIEQFIATVIRKENLKQVEMNEVLYKIFQLKETFYSDIYKLNRAYRHMFSSYTNSIESIVTSRNSDNTNSKEEKDYIKEYPVRYKNRCSSGYIKSIRYTSDGYTHDKCILIQKLPSSYNTYYKNSCAKGYIKSVRYGASSDFTHDKCISIENLPSSYDTYYKNSCASDYIKSNRFVYNDYAHETCIKLRK